MARAGLKSIAVSGASGMIGRALVPALKAEGMNVVTLVRRPPSGPDEVRWDPEGGTIDAGRLRGVDGVVHLAGENLAGGLWTASRRRRILESRRTGTRVLAEALAGLAEPPRVLISMSAVGYYGDRGDTPLTESAPNGKGFLADVVRVWEQAAEPARAAGVRVVHPRLGVVLHPGGGMLAQLLIPFRLGLGARLGDGDQWLSWITLDDAIAALRWLLHREDVDGPVNLASPAPVTNRAFTSTLARALHRPACLAIPASVLVLALGDLAREALLSSTRAIPGRLQQLGYGFTDPDLGPALERMLRH